MSLPYIEDQKFDDPEHYRIIGFANGMIATFIVEYRFDELGKLCGWSLPGKQPNQNGKYMTKKPITDMACDERLRQIQAGRQSPPKESN